MAENKHYGKQVTLSLIITLVVLVALFYCFGTLIIPKYQLTDEQIYSVAIKLFPILVGLVMVQAGVMIAHRHDNDDADDVDKLPPNAYDAPLSRMPGDDPSVIHENVVATTEPVAETTEQPAALTMEEVPVQKEAEEVVANGEDTINDDFESVFNHELKASQEQDSDLSLAVLKVPEDDQEKYYGKVAVMTSADAFSYTLDNGTSALIFPFFNKEEVNDVVSGVQSQLKDEFSEVEPQIGIASRGGRVLSTDILLHEANISCGV